MTDNGFTPIASSEIEAILSDDLQRELPEYIRSALLKVILEWAKLDMATAFFVSLVAGLTPDEGADRFGRKEIADKLNKAANKLRDDGNISTSHEVQKIADEYKDMAFIRRRIAHSKCAGVRKSMPDRIIFMPFEREGPPKNLAVEVIDVSRLNEAAAWAKRAHDYFLAHVDQAGFFEV